MSKRQPQKQPLSPVVKIAIGVGVLLVLGVLALGINSVRMQKQAEQQRAEQARQSSIRKKQEQPKFKDFDSSDSTGNDSSPKLSKSQAIKKMQADIRFGFDLIKATEAIGNAQLTRKQLSYKQNKDLSNHFSSIATFNSFNSAVNISTPNGANYYGQGGKYKTYKTAKPSDYYVVTGGSVEYNDSAYNNYIFDVNLQYKAGNYKNKVWLKISVDRTSGVISSVDVEGNKNNA